MKFIADDGTIFNTIEECEDYEAKISAIPLALYWHSYITMLNEDGEIVEPDADPTQPDYLKHLANLLDDDEVWYLIIPKKCDNDVQWKKLCDFIDDEYSVNIATSSGVWHWNGRQWCNFEDEYKKFINQWKPIKGFLPSMDAR